MPDIEYMARMLRVGNPLIEGVDRAAVRALQLPSGSRGLDAGCGIGLQAVLLAESVGPAGHVTGLDLSPGLLDYAKDVVEEARLSERVSLREGDVRELPFDDDTFDWAWSKDCVAYFPPTHEPLPMLRELARVVKPAGTVAILAWSSERLIPGHPLLEARLNATSSGVAPFTKGLKPELHSNLALGWFREVGMAQPIAQTFVGDAHAPLAEGLRSALVALFGMRWSEVESELTPEDWSEYQRLCLPESPDFIVDHPDYYAFFTYSMFRGRVAE
jgi:demethylmenaquinone methyltransferase/2-methoxy-6-polyprenyl-1,4-benzoquinol methylase